MLFFWSFTLFSCAVFSLVLGVVCLFSAARLTEDGAFILELEGVVTPFLKDELCWIVVC